VENEERGMLDESTLRQLYLEQQRSIRDIAALEHVPTRTVYDALIRYRIPRRPSGLRSVRPQLASALFDEATLRRLYLQEQRSICVIAALHHVSTRMAYDALSRYRIPRRAAAQRRPTPLVAGFVPWACAKSGSAIHINPRTIANPSSFPAINTATLWRIIGVRRLVMNRRCACRRVWVITRIPFSITV